MNLAPLITDRIQFNCNGVQFDLELRTNLTLIDSNSGTGKTMTFNAIKESNISLNEQHKIKYFSIKDVKSNSLEQIREDIINTKGKLIIIDDADVLLDNAVRRHIAFDVENQYVVIGRVIDNLFITRDEICRPEVSSVESTGKKISLKYYRDSIKNRYNEFMNAFGVEQRMR